MKLILAIAVATGIARPVDPMLTDLAQQRAMEISTNFEHISLNLPYTWGEVIGWNRFAPDPVAYIVQGWMNSPEHAAILNDPRYDHIGCGINQVEDTYYFVCILADENAPKAHIPKAPTAPIKTPIPLVPNTAIDNPF